MKQFADFTQLKALKKELDAESSPRKPERKSKTVVHPSIHEAHARNEGLTKGLRVRMMDSSDEAVIIGFSEKGVQLEFPGGLVATVPKSEFYVINRDEDLAMLRSVSTSPEKKRPSRPASAPAESGAMTVDLHLDKIPGADGVPQWAALDCQLDWFRRVLRENLKHKGRRIVFIHGFGDGTLKEALQRELDEAFALSCSYTSGTADNYGPGTIIVTIR